MPLRLLKKTRNLLPTKSFAIGFVSALLLAYLAIYRIHLYNPDILNHLLLFEVPPLSAQSFTHKQALYARPLRQQDEAAHLVSFRGSKVHEVPRRTVVKKIAKPLAVHQLVKKEVAAHPTAVPVPAALPQPLPFTAQAGYKWVENATMALPTSFPSEDLVVGLAFYLDVKSLAVFASSLRQFNRQATVLLLVNSEAYNTNIYQNHLGNDKSTLFILVNAQGLSPTYLRTFHPSSLRWVLFHRLLQARVLRDNQIFIGDAQGGKRFYELFSRIITADVLDTVFQSDPFPLLSLTASELLAFSEETVIGSCSWDRAWVSDCFGELVLSWVQDRNVICSGVSAGDRGSMVRYFEYMARLLQGQPIPIDKSIHSEETRLRIQLLNQRNKLPLSERNGVDQGVHNVLLRMHLLPATIKTHYDFPVINLQSAMDTQSFQFSEGKLFAPSPNLLYSIVHQYDRHYAFQQTLLHYIPWIASKDSFEEFGSSSACAGYRYAKDVDVLRGRCDLSSQRALTLASCCELCEAINTKQASKSSDNKDSSARLCMGFTYVEGVCYFKQCSREESEVAFLAAGRDQSLIQSGAISVVLK